VTFSKISYGTLIIRSTTLFEINKKSCFILGIEAIQEEVLAALKHKTPSVKLETAAYLARCFARCPPLLTTNKKASTILSALF
jgi:hypothetical protein